MGNWGYDNDGNPELHECTLYDEYLEEIGFVMDEETIENKDENHEIWRLGDFSLACTGLNKFFFNDDETAKALGLPLKMPIEAFHHLQNLYFWIKGEELDVSEYMKHQ